MLWRVIRLCGLSVGAFTWLLSCSTSNGGTGGSLRATNGGASSIATGAGASSVASSPGSGPPGGLMVGCDPTADGSACNPATPTPTNCGDGKLDDDEACDDGNRNDGDGCQGNCLATQPGFSCSPPGKPCHELVICGDKIVGSSEQCDDGNKVAGDGCSPTCKFEVGFKCDGAPSVCTPTVCGDGKKEGAESCDDGNAVPFDGCSSTCQTEPKCTSDGCTSECGDGILINEECDDGNTKDGDGCSHDCKKEGGFMCSQTANCEKINDACVLRVPVIYRDTSADNTKFPDVEPSCLGSGMPAGTAATPGLVNKTLTNGVPTQVSKATTGTEANGCITALDTWYSDKGSPAIVRDIVLFDNGKGGFVNRYGAMGEQWSGDATYKNPRFCGNGDTMCVANPPSFSGCMFDATVDTCLYPCPAELGAATDSCAAAVTPGMKYDGNPLFFPLDDQPKDPKDPWIVAKIPTQYGYNWVTEATVIPGAKAHNFHFTTQVTYWFKYDAKATAHLDFTGDDDVWVFLNDKLAVDLGGVHQPVDGGVSISAATAATYGLTDGNVYRLNIFHTERKKESSSFRLTLAGFDTAKSECTPICGDGIVSLGEQCDDGVNDGGYGECAPGCVIGPYCGDGIIQDNEECDDGNRLSYDGCSASCRVEVVK